MPEGNGPEELAIFSVISARNTSRCVLDRRQDIAEPKGFIFGIRNRGREEKVSIPDLPNRSRHLKGRDFKPPNRVLSVERARFGGRELAPPMPQRGLRAPSGRRILPQHATLARFFAGNAALGRLSCPEASDSDQSRCFGDSIYCLRCIERAHLNLQNISNYVTLLELPRSVYPQDSKTGHHVPGKESVMTFKMVTESEKAAGRIAGTALAHAELIAGEQTARWSDRLPDGQEVVDAAQIQRFHAEELLRLREVLRRKEAAHLDRLEDIRQARERRDAVAPALRQVLYAIRDLFKGVYGEEGPRALFLGKPVVPVDATPLRRVGRLVMASSRIPSSSCLTRP